MSLTEPRRVRAAALLAGGVAAGVVGAWALSSNAQPATTSTTSTSAPPSPGASGAPAPDAGGPHDHFGPRGAAGGHNPDEKSVTTAQAATLKAAALAHVPGGTVDRVETDSGDAAYEVHMTNASGKQVTVKFDKKLAFVAVEDGMGK